MTKVLRFVGFALCGIAVAACSPIYKLDIQQGNLLTKSLVDSLKPGMTKHQVTLVMGSPSVVSPFDQNRWDYVSTLRRGNGRMETKDLTLYFDGDALARLLRRKSAGADQGSNQVQAPVSGRQAPGRRQEKEGRRRAKLRF
jgi:outer membrane protein assembly factor BamE (lipoprotein component of BamABCDE complex)